ncbi:MAG: carboxyvinyl-carboxyphosphonate phosphorylmutase [Streptosporangiales bacterium]|nr:carboxyvinyl-carboxyphosphonate phosphorylmutase [Streptosporangiales bacterium]
MSGTSFRAVLDQNSGGPLVLPGGGPLVLPGGGTPLEARAAQHAGFPAFYVSGYAVAAWRHGLPDIGLIAGTDVAEAAAAVSRVVDVPIVCDADTGYGDVAAVHATVRLLESRGVSAIQLEDQRWPKRCGHLGGKEVVDADTAARKIAAACQARRDADTMIIARTDSLAPLGLDEAIARAKRFKEAGADVLFVDAPTDVEQLTTIGAELDGPLVVNMSEGGRTPALSATELYALGYRIVLFPTTALRTAAKAIGDSYAELARTGDTRPIRDRMYGLDEMNDLVDLAGYQSLEENALGSGG